jgi:hypothetical protein
MGCESGSGCSGGPTLMINLEKLQKKLHAVYKFFNSHLQLHLMVKKKKIICLKLVDLTFFWHAVSKGRRQSSRSLKVLKHKEIARKTPEHKII